MYNTNNYYNAKEELASLPENYTIEMALENNDVLGTLLEKLIINLL